MHCRPWFLQAFSISKQSSNSDRFFGNCCIGDKTMNFCFKILNMQVKKDTFNCWFLFQRYLTAGIIYIKLFLNFGYGRKSVMTLPHPQLIGKLFSPSQKVKKLSHPFRLCFELGLGVHVHHAKYQGVFMGLKKNMFFIRAPLLDLDRFPLFKGGTLMKNMFFLSSINTP